MDQFPMMNVFGWAVFQFEIPLKVTEKNTCSALTLPLCLINYERQILSVTVLYKGVLRR